MLHEMGMETGHRPRSAAGRCSRAVQACLGRPLGSHTLVAGPVDWHRRECVMFESVLVANRGEIALPRDPHPAAARHPRRSPCYTDADADAPHVREADDVRLAHRRPTSTIERVLDAARATRAPRRSIPATASCARTPAFARACADAGVTSSARAPEAMELLGDKVRAKAVGRAGVPVVPGRSPSSPIEEIVAGRDGD